MQWQRAWVGLFFLIALWAPGSFAQQEEYIDPELLDIKKIRETENLSENYKIARTYIFLAIKKSGKEYEAYVTKDSQDLDSDTKNVLEEPNDLAEFETLKTFQKTLEISHNKHTCYITALPHFEVLFPELQDPFRNSEILEVPTEVKNGNEKSLEGTKTLPLIDSVTGDTLGLERYTAFYNKEIKKVEITKTVKEGEVDKTIGTGEFQETIGPGIGSFGFIFMQLEHISE